VPNSTVVTPTRFVPLIVTDVPPEVVPVFGVKDETVGAAINV
jgi:hypothetical protein